MQKKNILRLLTLAIAMIMVLAFAVPALAATDEEPEELDAELLEAVEEEEEEEAEEVEEEEVVEEEVEEEAAPLPEYAWVKFFSAPVYSAKSADALLMSFRAFTKVKIVEADEYWTKIQYGLWFNNLDGQGNQIKWVPAYIPSSYLTYEKPEFESLYNVYVAR